MRFWPYVSAVLVLCFLLPASGIAAETALLIGEVIAVKSTVYREHDGKREALARGAGVFVSDVIVAEGDGKAQILLNSGSIISVGEKARIRLADFPGTDNQFTTRISAEQGALRLLVGHAQEGAHFEIETETAIAAVRGTDWLIDVTPDQTSVLVLSGSVTVRSKAPGASGEVLLDKPGTGTDVKRGAAPSHPIIWGAKRVKSTFERASFE
ncbi:MAG TPA: FecR family protein [Candidatus Cybelea sp.]|nr:FecR family protein [Candidatus Cybelea sp.]